MGRWCSSVIAQSGAGRGKLPKAILYPWIPPHNLPPRNSVNSSTCSVSDLRQCQATTDLTLLAPPRSFWKIPIPDFQIVAIFITSFLGKSGCLETRGTNTGLGLETNMGHGRPLGYDSFGPEPPLFLISALWPVSSAPAKVAAFPGASGALPRSGHCCSLASPDPATMVAATSRQRRYTPVTLYILTTQH